MTLRRRLLMVIAVISLIAAACGNNVETPAVAAPEPGPATEAPGQLGEDEVLSTDVLALVIESVEGLSYSYEQGVSLETDLAGQELSISSDRALATGQVSGDDLSINLAIGGFLEDSLASTGFDVDDPFLGGLVERFASLEIDVWSVDGQVVFDLEDFANTISLLNAGVDSGADTGLSIFQDGPVSIDVERLVELGADPDTSLSDLVTQFGQGAPVVDPANIIDALSSIDALTDAGTDTVNGVEVDVYTATISLSDYSDAIGSFSLGPDAAEAEEFAAAFDDATVDLVLMVDADELVRQITTTVDMSSLFSTGDSEGINPGFGGSELVVETWQTFDNYGEDFDITPPDAVDVTSELAELLDS